MVHASLTKHLSKHLLIDIFCKLHKLFSPSDVRHFLNSIYVDDYIVFLSESPANLLEDIKE
jgi:hypothetical protein